MKTDFIKAVFLLFTLPCSAFADELHDMQSWWNITATGPIYQGKEKTNFKFWLEGIERLGDYYSRSTQGILRPGIGYVLNDTTSVWLGAAWIETGVPINSATRGERRIWQQLLWSKKYPLLTLTSRLRFEQRFIDTNPVVGWRLRHLFKIDSPLANNPQWSFVGTNEVFFSYAQSKGHYVTNFDQNRFFMGMGYKLNKMLTLELGYLNQFISRYHNADFLSNNIATNFLFKFN